jgi:alanine racemase
MADASRIDLPLSVGDEVVLIGESGKKEISADSVASLSGSINYEFVSRIGNRAKRFYLNETTPSLTQKSPPARRGLAVY